MHIFKSKSNQIINYVIDIDFIWHNFLFSFFKVFFEKKKFIISIFKKLTKYL